MHAPVEKKKEPRLIFDSVDLSDDEKVGKPPKVEPPKLKEPPPFVGATQDDMFILKNELSDLTILV